MTDFSFRASQADRPIANRVEGGKRPRSSMAPTIVLDKTGVPTLVAGSPYLLRCASPYRHPRLADESATGGCHAALLQPQRDHGYWIPYGSRDTERSPNRQP